MHEPAVALVEPARAKRLRHQGVEPEQQSHPEDREREMSELPTPAAAIADGPSGPTMMVSTTPIAIQPSSARTTGTAMRSIGVSSARIRGMESTGEVRIQSSKSRVRSAKLRCKV